MPFDNTPTIPVRRVNYAEPDEVTILRGAIELLADPNHWIKGRRHSRIWPADINASTAHCAVGAVEAVAHRYLLSAKPTRLLLTKAAKDHGFDSMVGLNDARCTTHAYLMNVLRYALRRALRDQPNKTKREDLSMLRGWH